MHHFRGKLLQGGRARLDPANVYVQYHGAAGGEGQSWYGYILVGSETDVRPGERDTLQLMDGRSGDLEVDKVTPDDAGGFRARFYGEGSLG